MSQIILRADQVPVVDQVRHLMAKGVRRILVQAPTGFGKTVLTSYMMKVAASKGMRCYFMVHRRELVKQSMKTFARYGLHHGAIAAGFNEDLRPLVQVCSIPSVPRRLERMPQPVMIIWDETHHIAAGSWKEVFKKFPNAYHIGLSATPERLDGRGLDDFYQVMVKGPSVRALIDAGNLCEYDAFAPGGIDTEGLHRRMGEFVRSEVSAAANKPTITGSAIREYRRHLEGKPVIVFAASIEHSMNIVAQAQANGIRARHVDGETEQDKRDEAIEMFANGDLDWLSNVGLFGEGFDVPGTMGVLDLAPTCSLSAYLQRFGRCLRTAPGKTKAIYLDHSGNIERHGLPDEEREWSLQGRIITASKGKSEPSAKVCPSCFAAQRAGGYSCSYCGFEFPIKARKILQADGELSKVSAEKLAERRRAKSARREQGQSETMEQLIELGKRKGYRRPEAWAKHVFMSRQAKKIRNGRQL